MKNYGKALAAFVFLLAVVVFVPVKADAAAVKPEGLKQTDANRSGVAFSWNAVEGADGYIIEGSTDGTTYTTFQKATTVPSYVVTGLKPGESLYVRVTAAVALDEEGAEWAYSDTSEPLETVTSPDAAAININCSERTETSLTFTWTPAKGATSYVIYDMSNKQVLATLPASVTTYKREGLVSGSSYGIAVEPVRTSATGFSASTNVSQLYNVYTNKGAPRKPSTDEFYVKLPNISSTSASFLAVDTTRQAEGYEVDVYKVKGGAKVKTLSASNALSTNSMTFSKNTPYKYRVRYYVTNNGVKTYGEWSDYRYFYNHSTPGKTKLNGRKNKKIIQKWSKVAGATGYTVYISTSKDGKYKKVKTLGKNAKSITITKIGKKKLSRRTTYYIKIVPTIKDGAKKISNDTPVINRSKSI